MPKYGGKGKFELPDSHEAAIRVPKGGSSCSNCRFVSADGKHCENHHWVQWNGGDNKLPYPADEYCSDWFEPNPSKMKKALSKRTMVR